MRVLITGGRGFLGRPVTSELQNRGHTAIPVGRSDGDLTDATAADRVLEEHRPDVVVHLAAAVGNAIAEREPMTALRDNAGSAMITARACCKRGVAFAYGSTTEVYSGTSLYALTKRWGEEAVRSACPNAIVLRFSWPYGPGVLPGSGRGAIVNILDQAIRGQRIPVYRGVARSWCWVGDAARAVAMLLEADQGGNHDIGRDDCPILMEDVARHACRLTGADVRLIEAVDPPAPLPPSRPLNNQELLALGWTPKVEFEEGLAATLEWLRSVPASSSA